MPAGRSGGVARTLDPGFLPRMRQFYGKLMLRPQARGSRRNRGEEARSHPASFAAFSVLRRQAAERTSSPSICADRPQGQLRRPITCLDEARVLSLFDVFVILLPLHRVRSANSVS